MQVHRDEDVASRIGPESRAGPREGVGEALTGERAGQPLSRESNTIRAPTLSHWRKAIRTAGPAPLQWTGRSSLSDVVWCSCEVSPS